jgi:hypothetical protein
MTDALAELREAVGETLDKDFGFWSSPAQTERRTRLYRAWKNACGVISSTPPPVTDAMIEAGHYAACLFAGGSTATLETVRRDYPFERLDERRRDGMRAIYLAMHAARSNQEATPDAKVEIAMRVLAWVKCRTPPYRGIPFRDIEALAEASAHCIATPVQEATRTVGDAELIEAIEPLLRFHETGGHEGDGSNGRLADIRNIIDALSHTSSCGGENSIEDS